MNILVFSWRGPGHPLAGGAEQVMHEHMKGWIAKGHSVTLFTSFFPSAQKAEKIDGVHIIRRGSQYLVVHLYAFFWYIFQRGENFDLVVDQFHGWPFFTPLYVQEKKLAVIQELTRSVWFKYQLPFGLNYILGPLGYLLEPLFFLFYKNIPFMTGSQSAKKELQTVGIKEKNIFIVPHGVLIDLPKKIPGKEKIPTIIFLGALAADKGIEDAIKTFGLLANKNSKYHYWIVGKGDENYLKRLKDLVRKLKIKNKVTFFGFVSQEKKFELLARAHVMINPSIREGWGLVNIEANTVGTPVVGYSSMGLVDSIKDGQSGVLCDINTPEHMSDAVDKILSDRNYLAKLSVGAIKWSKNFTWKSSLRESLKLLEKV